MTELLNSLLTPAGIATAVGVLLAGLAFVLGTAEVRRRRVALAVFHAFHIVADLDDELGTTKLDKVREGLKAADEWMRANGWRELKPGEVEVAKLGFRALHGEDKVRLARATAALSTASPQ